MYRGVMKKHSRIDHECDFYEDQRIYRRVEYQD